jgi:hypothetical protein
MYVLKNFMLCMALVAMPVVAVAKDEDSKFSAGVGMGAAYAGIGANVALVSDHDMKYLSAGCVAFGVSYGATCGFGAGWIVTDLFNADANRHGWGMFATKAGNERYIEFIDDDFIYFENDYYGAGVSYTYFMNGIGEPGFNFGISMLATNAKYDEKINGFLQFGYQF